MAAKPKAVIIVGILAVAIAAVAAYFLYNYLRMQEKRVSEAMATENIVIASKEISIGSSIKDNQIKTASWPKANIPQGAILSKSQVVGRIALQTIVPGDAITESKLLPKEAPAGVLTYKIPEGHRAMTVGVDQVSGVAGFVNPGNIVDVVLTTTPPGGKQAVSKVVLQNIPILAVGQIVEQKEGKPKVVPTVTMDVTPQEAEKLAIATNQGRLQLVLRRIGDKEEARTSGATVTKVLSGVKYKPKKRVRSTPTVKKVEPSTPVKTIVSVEVLKGGKKTTRQFNVK